MTTEEELRKFLATPESTPEPEPMDEDQFRSFLQGPEPKRPDTAIGRQLAQPLVEVALRPSPRATPKPVVPPAPVPRAPRRNLTQRLGIDEESLPMRALDRVGDLGVSLTKGIIGMPEAVVGLADIPTLGRAGRAAEWLGFKPAEWKEYLSGFYSRQQQVANRKLEEADGLVEVAVTALKNPSLIAQTVVESAPTMVGGGIVARQLIKRGVNPLLAAATGEGVVAGGLSAEGIRQETESGNLSFKQAATAAASGAATGALGRFGGKLAEKMGIDDIDVLIAAGLSDRAAGGNLVRAVALGAVQEGFLEELPQSVQEQIATNFALDRDLTEGLDHAAVLGTLAGGVMGGGANLYRGVASSPAPTPGTPPVAPIRPPTPEEVRAGEDAHEMMARIKAGEDAETVRAEIRTRRAAAPPEAISFPEGDVREPVQPEDEPVRPAASPQTATETEGVPPIPPEAAPPSEAITEPAVDIESMTVAQLRAHWESVTNTPLPNNLKKKPDILAAVRGLEQAPVETPAAPEVATPEPEVGETVRPEPAESMAAQPEILGSDEGTAAPTRGEATPAPVRDLTDQEYNDLHREVEGEVPVPKVGWKKNKLDGTWEATLEDGTLVTLEGERDGNEWTWTVSSDGDLIDSGAYDNVTEAKEAVTEAYRDVLIERAIEARVEARLATPAPAPAPAKKAPAKKKAGRLTESAKPKAVAPAPPPESGPTTIPSEEEAVDIAQSMFPKPSITDIGRRDSFMNGYRAAIAGEPPGKYRYDTPWARGYELVSGPRRRAQQAASPEIVAEETAESTLIEHPIAAVVRDTRTNQDYYGDGHTQALDAARKALGYGDSAAEVDRFVDENVEHLDIDLFETSEGRIVGRPEANQMQRNTGRAYSRGGELHSDALRGRGIFAGFPVNVELQSNLEPRMSRFGELPAEIREELVQQAIDQIVTPIARSEGLTVPVASGLGSWFSEGSLAVADAIRISIPANIKPATVKSLMSRLSIAMQQAGYFAARPSRSHTGRWAVELSFGRDMSDSDYRTMVETISRDATTFNGTTMVGLTPGRVQIVLNEVVDPDGVTAELGRIAALFPEERISVERYQVDTVENFDANSFGQDARSGPEKRRVDREAGAAYDAIAARVQAYFDGQSGPIVAEEPLPEEVDEGDDSDVPENFGATIPIPLLRNEVVNRQGELQVRWEKTPEEQGKKNPHSLMGFLRERVDNFQRHAHRIIDRNGKNILRRVLGGTSPINADRQIEALDDAQENFPNPLASEEVARQYFAYALQNPDIPLLPYAAIKRLADPSLIVADLGRATDRQLAQTRDGMFDGLVHRHMYEQGLVDVNATTKLFLWAFLSRGKSVSVQESAFLDAIYGQVDYWITLASEGGFTQEVLPDYLEWAASVLPVEADSPGSGTISNLNSFGKDFLMKMSKPTDDGRSGLQRLHDMIADPKTWPSKELRREFHRFAESPGINNKVLSFALLLAGRTDVLVLDRVRIRVEFNDGRFGKYNLYDGVKSAEGQSLSGSGVVTVFDGISGLMYYEALEQEYAKVLPQVYQELGYPESGDNLAFYHWLGWVVDSDQEVSHGVTSAIFRESLGEENPYEGVAAREGKTNTFLYGAEYMYEGGKAAILYPLSDETYVKMTPTAFKAFMAEIKKENGGVLLNGFPGSRIAGRGQPWWDYIDPASGVATVDRRALDKAARGYGQTYTRRVSQTADAEAGADGAGRGRAHVQRIARKARIPAKQSRRLIEAILGRKVTQKSLNDLVLEETAVAYPNPELPAYLTRKLDGWVGDAAQYFVNGVPTVASRMRDIVQGMTGRGQLNIIGQKVESPAQLANLLRAFRDPRYEHSHFVLLDDNGNVVYHSADTSGTLGRVEFNVERIDSMLAIAVKKNARRVIVVHNHPSGRVDPSSSDLLATNEIRGRLANVGLELDHHLIINHDQATMIRYDQKTGEQVADHIQVPVDQVADWTNVTKNQRTLPPGGHPALGQKVAQMVRRAIEPGTVFVLHLDTQRQVIAMEPHTQDSLAQEDSAWLSQQMEDIGSAMVLLVTGDAATQLNVDNAMNAFTGMHNREVLDVIRMDPAGNAVASSRAEGNLWAEKISPPRSPIISGMEVSTETDPNYNSSDLTVLEESAPDPDAAFIDNGHGYKGIITRNMKGPVDDSDRQTLRKNSKGEWVKDSGADQGSWRYTRFTPTGEPITHTNFRSREDAIEYATSVPGTKVVSWEDVALFEPKPDGSDPRMDGLQSKDPFERVVAMLRIGTGQEQYTKLQITMAVQALNDPALAKALQLAPEGRGAYAVDRWLQGIQPTDPQHNDEVISPHQIISELSDGLEVPILATGNRWPILRRRTVAGAYKSISRVIRIKQPGDIETAMHEVGHHVHELAHGLTKQNRLTTKGFSQVQRDELIALGRRAVSAKAPDAEAVREGVAEFYRLFVTNPQAAAMQAPEYHDYVVNTLAARHRRILDLLMKARHDFDQWRTATDAARLRSMISSVAEPDADNPNKSYWDSFVEGGINDLHFVKKLTEKYVGKDAPITQQVHLLAQLARGAGGAANHVLKFGTYDWNTRQRKGPGLQEILKPIFESGQRDDFTAYIVARRGLWLLQNNKGDVGFDRDTALRVSQQLENQTFKEAFDKLVTYNRHMLEMLRDAGVISQDDFDRIEQYGGMDHYVPFHRERGKRGLLTRRSKTGALFLRGSVVKRFVGSTDQIIDPLESMIKNTYQFVDAAFRQRVSDSLVNLFGQEGAGNMADLIKPAPKVTVMRLGEIWDQVQRDTGGALDNVPDSAKDTIARIFRPGDFFGKDNIISITQNGQRVWYEVTDPDLYKALMGVGREQLGFIWRMMAIPSTWRRAGAILSPEFMIRNPVRDQQIAFIQTTYGFTPVIDWVRGVRSLIAKDDMYRRWQLSGGEYAAMVDVDRAARRNTLASLEHPVVNVIKNPLHMLQALSALMENGTRLGEFMNAYESEVAKGTSDLEAMDRGAIAARTIATDYAQHGNKTAALRAIATFWNAGVQGDVRTLQAFRDPKTRRAATLKALITITLPSIGLALLYADDDEYWEIPQWQRDLFWMVKVPVNMVPSFLQQTEESGAVGQWLKPFVSSKDGVWVRMPKPFGVGQIFGSVWERVIEWQVKNDPEGLKETAGDLLPWNALTGKVGGNSLFGGVPDVAAFQPFIENFANYSRFLDRPIESRSVQGLSPEYRYNDRTSEFAKWAVQTFHRAGLEKVVPAANTLGLTSPMKFENTFRSWTAGLGQYFLSATNALVPREEDTGPRAAHTLADVPLIKAFAARNPGWSSESITRFYEHYNNATQAVRDSENFKKSPEKWRAHRARNQALLTDAKVLAPTAEQITKWRQLAQLAENSEMHPARKRAMIDEYGRNATAAAQRALALSKSLKQKARDREQNSDLRLQPL